MTTPTDMRERAALVAEAHQHDWHTTTGNPCQRIAAEIRALPDPTHTDMGEAGEPVAWRYRYPSWRHDDWRMVGEGLSPDDLKSGGYIVEPLYPASALSALRARIETLTMALEGVIRVADRKTAEFDAARAALQSQPKAGGPQE